MLTRAVAVNKEICTILYRLEPPLSDLSAVTMCWLGTPLCHALFVVQEAYHCVAGFDMFLAIDADKVLEPLLLLSHQQT